MTMQNKIRTFVVDNFLFGEDRGLTEETSFLEEGILDSTGIMQLVAFLGEEFSVVIEDHELLPDNLDSIGKVCAFIRSKQPAPSIVDEVALGRLTPVPA
jgi:acyl carrier protein